MREGYKVPESGDYRYYDSSNLFSVAAQDNSQRQSMSPLEFAVEDILVSASGPLFFINILYGSKRTITGGIKIAFGHTMVEFPLVITLALGLSTFSHCVI